MRLTPAQKHLLDDGTESQRKAMQILLAVGRLADAPRLIPITSAHVSGVSYKLIGDPGLEFLEDFAREDRKSTRLNSSHANISYAVFCLKKKNEIIKSKHKT